jgi:small nuclear ribonucleoprotein (snRNP)-like protein
MGPWVGSSRCTAALCAQQHAVQLLQQQPPHAPLPELDFASSRFDPFMALHAGAAVPVAPPNCRAAPLDFLDKCRCLLPARNPHYTNRVQLERKEQTPQQQQRKAAAASARLGGSGSARDGSSSVVGSIAESAVYTAGCFGVGVPPIDSGEEEEAEEEEEEGGGGGGAAVAARPARQREQPVGPFVVLLRCFREKRRVRVTVRRINSLHSVCTGQLRAFDKHMNLVLQHVEEVFAPRPAPRRQRQQYGQQQEPRRRHLQQILIRGDNIVLVAAVPKGGWRGGKTALSTGAR